MDKTEKLESYKIDIRSILLSYQKGCYLKDFNRAYCELIGRTLPFREMGYNTDIEFLFSMPDVVKITPSRGTYHLMGVADDKSKHIQKMVARQKPEKLRAPPIRSTKPPRYDCLPPRFSRFSTLSRQTHDSSLRFQAYSKEPEMPPISLPKEEPKKYEEPKMSKDEPKMSKKELKMYKEESKLPPKSSPMEEVIALVQYLKQLAVDDVLCEYKRMYNKNLSLSTYGFSSIVECLYEIPELEIVQENNVQFVRLRLGNQVTLNNSDDKDGSSLKIPPPAAPSSNNSESTYKQNCDNGNIPTSLEEKLLKVSERYEIGILAADFLHAFENVTGHTLDFVNLGYRCLIDLIDDVPHIFTRTHVPGSKKDFLIYPAKNFNQGQTEIVYNESPLKHIAYNLRKLLVAYPEGIKLQELTHVYSINYKDSLHIKDFGFDDLEKFLASLKIYVPIRFGSTNGVKSIHLVKIDETPGAESPYMDPEVFDKEAIPFDAVFPEFKYKPHTFPTDFDFSIYIPAYTSSVAHAGHLYLQFQEDFGLSNELTKLGADIDNFYNGNESELYTMKTIHIAVGASCIAKWPADNHWYRAQILSIPSMQNVEVIYVDYGTTDIIPKFLLRYTKKEFSGLPVQAVRCRLAFLKPPNNAPKWNIETRNRILKLCQDVPLMAKIEEIGPDGVYSVLLCDTNGEDDVYINDVLIEEGLADNFIEPSENILPSVEPKTPEVTPYLHPLQALQAQYFLQAFAAVAPIFAQNEKYLSLLNEVSALCRNSDPVSQSTNIPFVPAVGPPGFNTFPQGLNPFSNPAALYNSYPSAASAIGTNPIRKSKTNTIPPPKDFLSASLESPKAALAASPEALPAENGDIENEIFDDDDDEVFQQFCQKVSNFRQIKRVMLGDGYKIHIIVLESQPYASSGEISQLIWNNKEPDYLLTRLQLKDIDIPVVMLSEDGHEQLFQQLMNFNVKGVQTTKGFKSSVVLYTLRDVMKILNIFGHPSVTLRTRLTEEISNFNPNDQYWRENDEYSLDSEPEDEDSLSAIVYSSATDDDKIEKLCLYDLLAMKESIVCKRKQMMSSTNLCKSTDEIDKLEKLLQKVLNRIREIGDICDNFS